MCYLMTSFRDNAWLAGFTDGEACFLITPKRISARENTPRFAAHFTINLRSDDLQILEELRAEFGGSICVGSSLGRLNPIAKWRVANKQELLGLVEYFDRFPLRAKKARDYAIWREAALIYCAHGSYAPELGALNQALCAGRKFGAEEPVVEFLPAAQLRLVS